jgi:hypothetical protein
MLKILGRELKRPLRGGKFLYLIAILAAVVIYTAYALRMHMISLLSGTLSEAFCSAGSIGFITVCMTLFTIASFEEDASRGLAEEAAAVTGTRASFFGGKMLGIYIITAIMTALSAVAVALTANASGTLLTQDTGAAALSGVIFFEAAALISTAAGFISYASGKPSYGFYTLAVLFFIPPYIRDFVLTKSGVDIARYEILSCAEDIRMLDTGDIRTAAALGIVYLCVLWAIFYMAAGRKRAVQRA